MQLVAATSWGLDVQLRQCHHTMHHINHGAAVAAAALLLPPPPGCSGADPNFVNGAGDLTLFWAIDGGAAMIKLLVRWDWRLVNCYVTCYIMQL